ncbi:MAG: phosphate ABC transporter permease PstA [Eubacteriales bacterium]|nr:phosphate ABC transporter permease PstA [Eubacteriales bacterium]
MKQIIQQAPARANNRRVRKLKDLAGHAIFLIGTLFSVVILIILLTSMLSEGLRHLDWQFLTSFPSRMAAKSGILPALVGSVWLIGLTALIAIPVGIGAAIYIENYGKDNRFNRLIKVNIANLAGVPSIVYGMLGLSLFVRTFGFGRSILSGALTMALLILPILIVAASEALRDVPKSIIEGSYAVGSTKLQTITKMILPYAFPRILTGIILALSRAIGETAPLLLIGAFSFVRFLPENVLSAFTVLPIQIYVWAGKPQASFHEITSAAIIVLLIVMILINGLAIFLRNKFETGKQPD